jgi:hypothetical protein
MVGKDVDGANELTMVSDFTQAAYVMVNPRPNTTAHIW